MNCRDVDFADNSLSETEAKAVQAPFDYLTRNTQGKNLRGKLIGALNIFFSLAPPELEALSKVINTLHVSSLIVDDIEDDSSLRRGMPCAHKIFGVAQSINSSNMMYFRATALVQQLFHGHPAEVQSKAMGVFLEEIVNLHLGQGLDLYWRENALCPSEEEYLKMVMNKTGGLFRLSARLMAVLAGKEVARLDEFCNTLGVLFQIKDDLLNLKSEQYQKKKGFMDDISEGKFSFPIVRALHEYNDELKGTAAEEAQEILSILRQHTQDVELKKHCVELIVRSGSCDYALQTVANLRVEAGKMIEELTAANGIDAKGKAMLLAALELLSDI